MRSKADNQEPSDLGTLARQRFEDLTAAELALVRAAPKGELAVCGVSDDLSHSTNDPSKADQWGNERNVRADLIAWLCLDRRAANLIHPQGIKLLGAKISDAVDLSFINIGFPLVLARCRLRDLNLFGAQTRTISLQGSRVHTLLADGAVVSGAVFLRDGFHSDGGVQLTGATVHGPLDCTAGAFENAVSYPALTADGITVTGPVFLRKGFRASGEIRFPHAHVGEDFDCTEGTFKGQINPALNAEGIAVGGSIFLRNGFRADGLVMLHGAQIEFNLDCVRGRFENPALPDVQGTGTALNIDSSVVKGTVLLSDGFQAEGEVRLISSQIDGDLRCTGAKFGSGLVAERSVVKGTLFWRDILNPKTVNLNLINTSADSLSDDIASWPPAGNLQLHGFVYSRISAFSPRDAKSRLAWLARLKSFTPQPYRQLANILKDEADIVGAQKILYKMASLRSQESRSSLARGWSFILRYTVGYGYYPSRALLCLVVLAVVGSLLFWRGYSAGSMVPTEKDAYASFRKNQLLPDHYERFCPLVYSLENSFPLVKLGQADRWQPDPSPKDSAQFSAGCLGFLDHLVPSARSLRGFRWVQILLGWFFATMGISSVSGLVHKD